MSSVPTTDTSTVLSIGTQDGSRMGESLVEQDDGTLVHHPRVVPTDDDGTRQGIRPGTTGFGHALTVDPQALQLLEVIATELTRCRVYLKLLLDEQDGPVVKLSDIDALAKE